MLALRLTAAPARAPAAGPLLLAVTLAQGAVGYPQYFTDLPEALVALHMLGASLLVVAVPRPCTPCSSPRPAASRPPGGGQNRTNGSSAIATKSSVR